MNNPNNPCLFCNISLSGSIHENDFAYASYDSYPVSKFHCLIIPKSHIKDYFDLSKQFKGGLVEAFKNQSTKFLIISFSSDWLYTTKENKDIVIALNSSGADVSYSEIETDKGHDSFLLNELEFLKTLKAFIDSMYEKFKK